MRYLLIALALAVLAASPPAVTLVTSAAGADSPPVIAADDPGTLLDGIDWDEWLESISLRGWLMLDGIDWDEWLEGLFWGNPEPA